ncbi:MAG: NifB/NifX family molybdenum-iron cluster-binding protein [Verrucomicrobia bacterium]|mgnify:CR=1 FL=1|nr:NifB/NifX family molybdenum-iron cluster-binding protein [Verrucomicrobiota bacterium]
MTIALPICEGRISPVLDVACRFMVVEIAGGREISRREVLMGETQPALLVMGIKEMGAQVLLCGAMSQPIAHWLESAGVRVWPHLCGDADAVLQAFLSDTLGRSEFRMPGCCAGHCGWHRNRFRHRGRLRRSPHPTFNPTPKPSL